MNKLAAANHRIIITVLDQTGAAPNRTGQGSKWSWISGINVHTLQDCTPHLGSWTSFCSGCQGMTACQLQSPGRAPPVQNDALISSLLLFVSSVRLQQLPTLLLAYSLHLLTNPTKLKMLKQDLWMRQSSLTVSLFCFINPAVATSGTVHSIQNLNHLFQHPPHHSPSVCVRQKTSHPERQSQQKQAT